MKLKSIKKNKLNKSEEKKIQTKNDLIKKNNLTINIKPKSSDKFPKNVNEFRHIMDDVNCFVPDIEFMLELRRYNKYFNKERNSSLGEPPFYQDDLTKYKNKNMKNFEEKKILKTNIGTFHQIFSNRAQYAINNTTYRYEVGLRTESNKKAKSIGKKAGEDKKNNYINSIPWNSTLIPKERSLFDKLLPPILQPSKEVFSKYDNKIGRPIIKIKKDGYINENKVYSRIFDYNKNLANRFPSEHFPSSKYTNDYGTQNIEAIRHLLNSDNRTMTSYWSTHLRGLKKIKYLKDDIIKREKKLRDIINGKNYAGK